MTQGPGQTRDVEEEQTNPESSGSGLFKGFGSGSCESRVRNFKPLRERFNPCGGTSKVLRFLWAQFVWHAETTVVVVVVVVGRRNKP